MRREGERRGRGEGGRRGEEREGEKLGGGRSQEEEGVEVVRGGVRRRRRRGGGGGERVKKRRGKRQWGGGRAEGGGGRATSPFLQGIREPLRPRPPAAQTPCCKIAACRKDFSAQRDSRDTVQDTCARSGNRRTGKRAWGPPRRRRQTSGARLPCHTASSRCTSSSCCPGTGPGRA